MFFGLIAGTVWGEDDHFPFGPFRMYSTTTRDRVTIVKFEAETAEGERVKLRPADFGLRPAEVQGQIRRLEEHPRLLQAFAEAYDRFHPDAADLARLEMIFGVHTLDNGRAISYHEETIATWSAS